MTLGVDDVMPLVLGAVPSFAEEWSTRVEAENAPDEPGGRRLTYLDVGEVLDHLALRALADDTSELPAVLDVVERLLAEGDDDVRELATVGYVESLQGFVMRGALPDVGHLLGPLGAEAWRQLDAFWG